MRNRPTRRTPRERLAALGLIGCLLAGGTSAQPADACLQAELAAMPDFSGVALVRQRGQLRVAATGLADAAGTALQTQARFNLGSASKMFTAVAVAQLVAQGKLSLDAPIGRWVEGLAAPVAAVTVRQLLTHSGGLGNYMRPDNLAALRQAKNLDAQMALVNDARPRFEPGSRFGYSNNGFVLLGRAVERASGQPFASYLQAQVFSPAAMSHTSLDPAWPTVAVTGFTRLPEWVPAGVPGPGSGPGPGPGPESGPGPTGSGPRPPPPPSGPLRPAAEAALPGTPAGSAYSSAADMARFFDALAAGKLLPADAVKEITRAQIDVSPPGAPVALQYGLGFGVSRWQGHLGYGHNGGAPGVNAEALHYPDDALLIIVLANRDPPQAAQLLATLRSKALGGTLCQ